MDVVRRGGALARRGEPRGLLVPALHHERLGELRGDGGEVRELPGLLELRQRRAERPLRGFGIAVEQVDRARPGADRSEADAAAERVEDLRSTRGDGRAPRRTRRPSPPGARRSAGASPSPTCRSAMCSTVAVDRAPALLDRQRPDDRGEPELHGDIRLAAARRPARRACASARSSVSCIGHDLAAPPVRLRELGEQPGDGRVVAGGLERRQRARDLGRELVDPHLAAGEEADPAEAEPRPHRAPLVAGRLRVRDGTPNVRSASRDEAELHLRLGESSRSSGRRLQRCGAAEQVRRRGRIARG